MCKKSARKTLMQFTSIILTSSNRFVETECSFHCNSSVFILHKEHITWSIIDVILKWNYLSQYCFKTEITYDLYK